MTIAILSSSDRALDAKHPSGRPRPRAMKHLDCFQDGCEGWTLQAVWALDEDQTKLHAFGPIRGKRRVREGAAEAQRADLKPSAAARRSSRNSGFVAQEIRQKITTIRRRRLTLAAASFRGRAGEGYPAGRIPARRQMRTTRRQAMSTKLGGGVYEHDSPMAVDIQRANLVSVLGVAGAQRQRTASVLYGAG
jgi:hypothetical protein